MSAPSMLCIERRRISGGGLLCLPMLPDISRRVERLQCSILAPISGAV